MKGMQKLLPVAAPPAQMHEFQWQAAKCVEVSFQDPQQSLTRALPHSIC